MAAGYDLGQVGGALPSNPATGWTSQQMTDSTAVDLATLQAAPSATGDYIVCRNASSAEKFVVDTNGKPWTAAIGTISVTANATTASFAVSNITSNDIVILTKRSSAAGSSIMVDGVSSGTMWVRTFANESGIGMNYLVIGKAT